MLKHPSGTPAAMANALADRGPSGKPVGFVEVDEVLKRLIDEEYTRQLREVECNLNCHQICPDSGVHFNQPARGVFF